MALLVREQRAGLDELAEQRELIGRGVVLRPHPGQANPGQATQDEGEVCVSPAAVLNDWILVGPPTAFHRLVAAELSLSSIICWASG